MRLSRSALLVLAALLSVVACVPDPTTAVDAPEGELAVQHSAVTVPGKWAPSASTLAAGDRQLVRHDGLPLTNGYCTSTNPWACSCGAHPECSKGLPGALELAAYLRRRFPQISGIGGVGSCCRQATGSPDYLSAHSLGRAIDVMIPRINGDADNTAGDPIGAWAIENAQSVGIQYIAWDRAQWSPRKPAGQRLSPLSASSLSHTDHLHIELNKDGAAKRTPFFTGGASSGGGSSCTPACRGSVIVTGNCTTGDCATYGATCIADPTPRCIYPQCPRTGTGKTCLDDTHIADCANGLPTSVGDCGAYGAWCSTAGLPAGSARCVFSLCVSGPTDVPTDVTRCSITSGKQLECFADGSVREVPCADGEICSMTGGVAHCEPELAECPVPAAGTTDDRTVCLDTGEVARCFNGNVISVTSCDEGATCSDVGGEPHCANTSCLESGAATACLSEFEIADCDATGAASVVRACAEGSACSSDDGEPRCAPVCGDGQCIAGETCDSCDADCGACPFCGDGACEGTEACGNCSSDCGSCAECGDGTCGLGESCSDCAEDCGACAGCGDGSCAGGETCATCAADCGTCARCDDGTCQPGETCLNCPGDCGLCAGCGDGSCSSGETCGTCPDDCGACEGCGDGACAGAEICSSCPEDCGACRWCGDGSCDPGESCTTCASDCGACPTCGDGTCAGGETCATCARDCGACAGCGDGSCAGGETCATCARDCGLCAGCGDGVCGAKEACHSCPADCGACEVCGDGTCQNDENCVTCSVDCGSCSVCGDGRCSGRENCENCARDCGDCSDGPDTDGSSTPATSGCSCGGGDYAGSFGLLLFMLRRRRVSLRHA